MGHVWMQHREHNGRAEFPEESAATWELKGWERCDPPVDPDPAMAEHQERTFPEPPAAEPGQDSDEPSTETEEH